MPPIVAFGRRFHFASDDLPFPSLLACIASALSAAGLAGSIFHLAPRVHVITLAVALLVVSSCTLGANIFGTWVMYRERQLQDLDSSVGFTLAWRTVKVMLAILWVTWIVLISSVVALVAGWNILGHHSAEYGWRSRCECMSGLLCCIPALNRARARQRSASKPPAQHSTHHTAAGQVTYTACAAEPDTASPTAPVTPGPVASLKPPTDQHLYAALSGSSAAAGGPVKGVTGLKAAVRSRSDESCTDVEMGVLSGQAALAVPPVGIRMTSSGRRRMLGGGREGASGAVQGADPQPDSRTQKLNEQDEPLDQLAQAFSHFFGHIDITLSDIATLLLLVGIHQRMQRQQQQQQQQATNPDNTQSQDPSADPSPQVEPSQGASAAALALLQSCPPSAAASLAKAQLQKERSSLGQAPQQSDPQPEALPLPLDDAQYYFKHACAIYGWPMFVYAHRKESPHRWLGVCCCCPHLFSSNASRLHPLQLEHNHLHHHHRHHHHHHHHHHHQQQQQHHQQQQQQQQQPHHSGSSVSALPPHPTDPHTATQRPLQDGGMVLAMAPLLQLNAMQRWTGLGARELLYCSLENAVAGVLPYYIVMDRARREVILAIRGSLSVSDVATDLLCQPTPVTDAWLAGGLPPHDTTATTTTTNDNNNGGGNNNHNSNNNNDNSNNGGSSSSSSSTAVIPDPSCSTPRPEPSQASATSGGEGAAGMPSDSGPFARARAPTPTERLDAHGREMLGGGLVVTEQQQRQQQRQQRQRQQRPLEGLQRFAHGGMLLSAQAVAEDLDRRGILDALLGGGGCSTDGSRRWRRSGHPLAQQDCSGFQLVCLGHSLGAGVAALLALRLTARYPPLTPPPHNSTPSTPSNRPTPVPTAPATSSPAPADPDPEQHTGHTAPRGREGGGRPLWVTAGGGSCPTGRLLGVLAPWRPDVLRTGCIHEQLLHLGGGGAGHDPPPVLEVSQKRPVLMPGGTSATAVLRSTAEQRTDMLNLLHGG
ncbi:MAG: hypothetical protein WDW38_003615 [Sanguina aurantia]